MTIWLASCETDARPKFVLCPVVWGKQASRPWCAELGRTWVFLGIFTQHGTRLNGIVATLFRSPSFERSLNHSQILGFWGTYLRFIDVSAEGRGLLQAQIPEAQLECTKLPNGKPDPSHDGIPTLLICQDSFSERIWQPLVLFPPCTDTIFLSVKMTIGGIFFLNIEGPW